MIARLDSDWYGHDFITKRAGDLIFDRLCEFVYNCFFLLLFLLLFLSFFLLFCIFPLLFSLFFFILLLLLKLPFFLLFSSTCQLDSETNRFWNWDFTSSQQPYLIEMFEFYSVSLPNFSAIYKGSICAQVSEGNFISWFSYRAVFSTQAFITYANQAFSVPTDENLVLGQKIGLQRLSISKGDEPTPSVCIFKC